MSLEDQEWFEVIDPPSFTVNEVEILKSCDSIASCVFVVKFDV